MRLLKTMVRGTRSVEMQLQSAMTLITLGEDTQAAWSRLQEVARSADLETGLVVGYFLRRQEEPEAVATLKMMLERDVTCLPALAALVEHEVAGKDELLAPYRRVEQANWFFMVDVNRAAAGRCEALRADIEKMRPAGLDVMLPLVEAMGEWHGLEALGLYNELVTDASRPERVAMAHNACWYPWNREARTLVRGFLAAAVDEDEVRHELRALGFIGNASDLPLLRKYLRVAQEPETRMMAAWAILNISRGLPITRASSLEA